MKVTQEIEKHQVETRSHQIVQELSIDTHSTEPELSIIKGKLHEKKKKQSRTKCEWQTSLAVSIMISVCSLVSSCSDTSVDVTLLVCNVFTSCKSSSREPLVSFSNLHTKEED